MADEILYSLEGEIHAGARHAEVVICTINEVPAEITDPADMRGEADFDSAADLANCLCLGAGTACNDNVVLLAFLYVGGQHKECPLAAAKDRTAATEDVWRKTGAGDRVTQRQSTQDRADRVALVANPALKNVLAEIDKDVFMPLPCIDCPAFNPDTYVTAEKVFEVETTAPSMIGLKVTIVYPIVSCKNVRAPNSDVKLSVCIPRWTR